MPRIRASPFYPITRFEHSAHIMGSFLMEGLHVTQRTILEISCYDDDKCDLNENPLNYSKDDVETTRQTLEFLANNVPRRKRHPLRRRRKEAKTYEFRVFPKENDKCITTGDIGNRCRTCDVSFRYGTDLRKHCEQQHGNDKPYYCESCRKSYRTKKTLWYHSIKKHTATYEPNAYRKKQTPVYCGICDVTIYGWMLFEKHAFATHKGMKMVRCPKCDKKYFRRKNMLQHVWRKHADFELMCEFCKNVFDRTDNLREHAALCERRQAKKFQGDTTPNVIVVDMTDVKIRCDECPGNFDTFVALKHHYKLSHPKVKLHSCDYCEAVYSCKGTLEKHVDMLHPDKDWDVRKDVYRKMKRYECEYCGDVLAGTSAYEKHGREQHPKKALFYCMDCRKGYTRRMSLKVHANEAHGGAKTRCSHCTKYYYERNRLRMHELVCKKNADRDERSRRKGLPLQHCVLCDKGFYMTKKAFANHVKRHEEYKFCQHCKSGFKTTNSLEKHIRLRHPNCTEK